MMHHFCKWIMLCATVPAAGKLGVVAQPIPYPNVRRNNRKPCQIVMANCKSRLVRQPDLIRKEA